MNDYQRFQKKISITSGACWMWMGSIDKKGYGRFMCENTNVLAHKYSYAFHKGKDVDIRNTCGNKNCVNPDHWEEGGRPVRIQMEDILKLKRAGLNPTQIAKQLNCSASLIRKRLKD